MAGSETQFPTWMRHVVLVTGKGGVGRTTVAASLASAAASEGKTVLLCDVLDAEERYSPLARMFGREKFLPEERLQKGIYGCHLHDRAGHELFLRQTLPGGKLISAALRSQALQRFLQAAPSFHEMGIFNHFLHLATKRDEQGDVTYDHIVVDMPATGHTLALTSLPDILLRLIPRGPIARLLRQGQSILQDPERSGAWVVTLPETLPVTESLELIEGLRETRMPVGGVILNRLPEDPFSDAERDALVALLEAKPLCGQRAFERIQECGRAARRLRDAVDVPLVVLRDIAEEGRALAGGLARQLKEEPASS